MTDLIIKTEEGRVAGRVHLAGILVSEEEFQQYKNFTDAKTKFEAKVRADAQRQISLANERADKATEIAAQIVANQVKDLVEEALSLGRKAQHMRISSEALKPLLHAANEYAKNLPRPKRKGGGTNYRLPGEQMLPRHPQQG